MSQLCPKCHDPVDESVAHWADITFTWKCRSCGRIVEWFMVPFDKCALCGGEMRPIAEKSVPDPLAVESLRTALQMELLSSRLYRLLGEKEKRDGKRKALIERLMLIEQGHFRTLSDRYHVHEPLDRDEQTEALILAWLAQGVDFADAAGIPDLIEKAIAMETKTAAFYDGLAGSTGSDGLRVLYRELAAEERSHAADLAHDLQVLVGAERER